MIAVPVHGMGVTLSGYANPLKAKLKRALGDPYLDLKIRPVYYQDALQDNEETVWDRVDAKSKVHYDDLRKFLLFGFGDAAGLEARNNDVNSVYEMRSSKLRAPCSTSTASAAATARSCSSRNRWGARYSPIISTTAGRQKMVDGSMQAFGATLTTLATSSADDAVLPFLRAETCMAWVTTGCNIPLFVAAHKTMNIKPIQPPNGSPTFKWLNIYDPDDVLGWPLQPLSPE